VVPRLQPEKLRGGANQLKDWYVLLAFSFNVSISSLVYDPTVIICSHLKLANRLSL